MVNPYGRLEWVLLPSNLCLSSFVINVELQLLIINTVHPETQHFKYSNEAAKKARFSPNYGCDEGKCGSCELKVNGKTKIRPCIGKVPAAGPVVLTEP